MVGIVDLLLLTLDLSCVMTSILQNYVIILKHIGMLLTGMFTCYLYVVYCIVEEQPGPSGLQQSQQGMYK